MPQLRMSEIFSQEQRDEGGDTGANGELAQKVNTILSPESIANPLDGHHWIKLAWLIYPGIRDAGMPNDQDREQIAREIDSTRSALSKPFPSYEKDAIVTLFRERYGQDSYNHGGTTKKTDGDIIVTDDPPHGGFTITRSNQALIDNTPDRRYSEKTVPFGLVSWMFDGSGRILQKIKEREANPGSKGFTVEYEYLDSGHLSKITVYQGESTYFAQVEYDKNILPKAITMSFLPQERYHKKGISFKHDISGDMNDFLKSLNYRKPEKDELEVTESLGIERFTEYESFSYVFFQDEISLTDAILRVLPGSFTRDEMYNPQWMEENIIKPLQDARSRGENKLSFRNPFDGYDQTSFEVIIVPGGGYKLLRAFENAINSRLSGIIINTEIDAPKGLSFLNLSTHIDSSDTPGYFYVPLRRLEKILSLPEMSLQSGYTTHTGTGYGTHTDVGDLSVRVSVVLPNRDYQSSEELQQYWRLENHGVYGPLVKSDGQGPRISIDIFPRKGVEAHIPEIIDQARALFKKYKEALLNAG